MTSLAEVLKPVKDLIPEEAKDLKLNLDAVVVRSSLQLDEAIGCALTAAVVAKNRDLVEAFSAASELDEQQRSGALTAGALMAMNTTWYPYVEMAEDKELANMPAGLRMNAYATHGGVGQERFELYALAGAIIGKCNYCISSHHALLKKAGRGTEQLRDVGRIAATVNGIATVLDTLA